MCNLQMGLACSEATALGHPHCDKRNCQILNLRLLGCTDPAYSVPLVHRPSLLGTSGAQTQRTEVQKTSHAPMRCTQ